MHMHIFKSRLKSYIEKQSIKLLERNVGEYLYLYDTWRIFLNNMQT